MHVQALKLLIWMIIRTLFASYSLLGYLLGYLLVINKTQEINFLALTQALKAANVVVVRIKKLRRIKKKRWYMGQKSKCNVPNSAGDKKNPWAKFEPWNEAAAAARGVTQFGFSPMKMKTVTLVFNLWQLQSFFLFWAIKKQSQTLKQIKKNSAGRTFYSCK